LEAARRPAGRTWASTVGDVETVHAFYDAALAAGGTDNGAPGPRTEYAADYYAAYVLDPDGNNIEAFCHTAAT
jgi:catechol 2,3-dioxygenase-like lactoylglutathione lyase family enzyme